MNLLNVIGDRLEMKPTDAAINFVDAASLTRYELRQDVSRWMTFMREKGVGINYRLALLLPRSRTYVTVTLAAAGLGATVVPLPVTDIQTLNTFLLDNEIDGVLGEPFNLEALTGVFKLPVPNAEAFSKFPLYSDSLLDMATRIFRVCHSSGTTGIPKGIGITHAQQLARLRQRAQVMPFKRGEKLLLCMGLDAEVAFTYILFALQQGVEVIVSKNLDINAVVKSLRESAAEYVLTSPFLWQQVVDAFKTRNEALPGGVKVLFVGGDVSDELLAETIQSVNVQPVSDYGSSESGMLAIGNFGFRDPDVSFAGQLLPEVRCITFNPETLEPLPSGKTGLLAFKSPGMVGNYWNSAEMTAKFFKSGWFVPGDMGLHDGQGHLVVGHRQGAVINRDGVKIDLRRIQTVINQFAGVDDSEVIYFNTVGKNRLVAFVKVTDPNVDQVELRQSINQKLMERDRPDQTVIVKSLPRTESGKIDRLQLIRIALAN